jgi:hypothetical protein
MAISCIRSSPTVATPDVVQNIEEIVEEHPHFSIRRLSQQIGSH